MNIDTLLLEKRRLGLPEVITTDEKELLDSGVPIQKIIGFIDFDNLRIGVYRNVLIPRYETQEVVNKALEYIKQDYKVLDLCTGSGYIGLTIKQKTGADVTMSDISEEAIAQAKENAEQNNLDVKIIKSDLFENINDKFDVIVSNPPYIPEKTKLDDSILNYEPHEALFAGKDGNDFYRRILKEYENYLKPNGKIIFEISEDNSTLLKEQGFTIIKDINNKDRIAIKEIKV